MKKHLHPALITLAAFTLHAHAVTFVVTRLDDPAPDTCQPGDCSLREAANAAQLSPPIVGTDDIQLAAGTYTLTRGPLVLDDGLSLVGAGASQTHVVTDGSLFGAVNGKTLNMFGMSIQTIGNYVLQAFGNSHFVLDAIAVPVGGGIIDASGNTDLEIRNSDLRDTVNCVQADGWCFVTDSQLVRFLGEPDSVTAGPVVQIQRTTFDGQLDPSGPWSGVELSDGYSFDIEDSDIVHTTDGIRIVRNQTLDETPTVTLRRVRYVDNAKPIHTEVAAQLNIYDSEFRDNSNRAIDADNAADVSISGTTFIRNSADDNAGGAVLAEHGARVHIENSTFSENTFSVAAASNGARGAAIGYRGANGGATLVLRHLTIVPPTIMPVGVEGTAIGGSNDVNVGVDISNSIVRGSCHFDGGALHNQSGNIESPGNTCGFDEDSHVSVPPADLALGTLGDHGGPTPTYEPAATSVAVDAAPAPQCLDLDQRGYARPFGSGCDVGAVEIGAGDRIFANGFE